MRSLSREFIAPDLDVRESLHDAEDVVSRSGLPKTMAFRLLYTLEKCGLIEKVGANLYQSCVRPLKHRLYRLGYAAQGTDYQFSREVSASLQRAAAAEGIELICFDN